MMHSKWLALALLPILAIAACSQQPQLPRASAMQRSTSVEVPMDIVTERVESKLEQLGFEIEAAGGGVVRASRRGAPDDGYATCGTFRVTSRTGGESTRYRRVEPSEEHALVIARISQIGAVTNVTLEPLMRGVYENSFNNRQIEESCPSNGKLEKALLSAVDELGPVVGAPSDG